MSEEQLLQIHSSHYEDCFVLSVDVLIDGEALQLEGHSKSLTFHCPHLNFSISPCELRGAVNEACLKHQVHFLGRMKCSATPLFELDFNTSRSVQLFLDSCKNEYVQTSIQTNLVHYISQKQIRPRRLSGCLQPEVNVKLFLLSPNVATRDPVLRLMTLENYQDCLQIFKRGRGFDYGALFRLFQEKKYREAPDFTTLANELKEVANWLTLGVNLRIPYHELQRIQLVHGLRYSGLLEMLDMWLKSGHASWVSLTQALKKTGFRTLANRIALTYGVPILDSPTHGSPRHIADDFNGLTMIDTSSRSVGIEEHDREAASLEETVKKTEKREHRLSSCLHEVRENLKDVTERLSHLTSQHQKLCNTLEKKKRQRSYLLTQTEQPDILKELIDDIEETITEVQDQICALEEDMQRCKNQEQRLQRELSTKQKELEDLRRNMHELRERNIKLQTELEAEKRVYDLKVRSMLAEKHSDEALKKELREQVSFLKDELRYKRKEIDQLLLHKDKKDTDQTVDELRALVGHLTRRLQTTQHPTSTNHINHSRAHSTPATLDYPDSNGLVSSSMPQCPQKNSEGGYPSNHHQFHSTPERIEHHIRSPLSPPPSKVPPRLQNKTNSCITLGTRQSPSPLEYDSRQNDFSRCRSLDRGVSIRRISGSGLEKTPWFYQGIDEYDAERLLTSNISFSVGMYLVRETGGEGKFSLSLLGRDQVYHIPIYCTYDSLYYLTNSKRFCSLEQLILHHQEYQEELPCCLTFPCAKPVFSKKETDVKNLILQQQLISGNQSHIFNGIMNQHQLVVVKAKKFESPLSDYSFVSEAILLRSLQHNNIHQFIAVTQYDQMLCILTEPVLNISLKVHLEKTKSAHMPLSLQTLLSIATQIARGMSFLESRNCIFRNLAAKNVVVTINNAIKISNFSNACYSPSGKLYGKSKILLRWSAPELIFESQCSSKSDVWSFGITLWEMLTYGDKPYGDLTSEGVKEHIKSGYRMPQLDRYPHTLNRLMSECWREKPRERPSFKNLVTSLTQIQ